MSHLSTSSACNIFYVTTALYVLLCPLQGGQRMSVHSHICQQTMCFNIIILAINLITLEGHSAVSSWHTFHFAEPWHGSP